jgi:hypothetical protein
LGSAAAAAAPTTTTTDPAALPVDVALVPCAAPSPGGPCRVDPGKVQLTYSPEKDPALMAIQLGWSSASGRPAPYSKPSTDLLVAAGQSGPSCPPPATAPAGSTAVCWAWPSTLTDPERGTAWILNGTYLATPCTAVSPAGACTPSKAYSPSNLPLAVPPAPPRSALATASFSGAVRLTWSAAASPEPDLIGYQVSRNGQVVYTCSTNAAGTACPATLGFYDQPAAGTWTYDVVALRFGANAAPADAVASSPATATVHTAAPTTSSGGPGPASLYLPPVPLIEPPGNAASFGPPPTTAATTATTGPGPTTTIQGQASPTLPYSAPTTPGQDSAALGSNARETGPKSSNLDSTAAIALGVLALALAAHVWYLRSEMGLFTAGLRPKPPAHRRSP